jgi:transposase-like protein
MKKTNKYSCELKEKIISECQEVGNVSVVARRYEIPSNTIHIWIKRYRERGSAER